MVSLCAAVEPQAREVLVRTRRRRTVPATPRLSVIVVNYCQWENTAALVKQLRRTRAMRTGLLEVVIVDNHSPGHKLIPKLRRCSGVSVRRWRRNRGFARAANEGCRLAQGEWFLLLNPDMSATPEFVEGAAALAEELTTHDPRAGIVGFHLRNSDGSRQFSTGVYPTLSGTLSGLAWPRERRKYRTLSGTGRRRVAWVTGCCLLVRGDCWRDLDGFAEEFFLYYEDVDLCRRASHRGWSIWYEPAFHAAHHSPIHARRVSPALRLITRHSLLTYGTRHWAGWQVCLLAAIVWLEAWARRLWAWLKRDRSTANLFREMRELARDLMRDDSRTARRRLERVVTDNSDALVSPVRTPEAVNLTRIHGSRPLTAASP